MLDAFFAPKAVAVVGASTRETSVGHAILRNLLDGYDGDVYPVNPKGGEILGRRAYENLAAIGASIDLMVVAIPPKFIPPLMEQAAGVGCKAAIIISAGFAELGEPGLALQREMLEAAKAHGIRLIGPNCLGVIRPGRKLNASFGPSAPPAGKIGLLSQSGALITGIISYAQREQFGLSAAVSLGAKADVDDDEIIHWLGSDDETAAIALYVESFPEPRVSYDTMREVARRKPIVAIKGGATEAGARAAASHTGSLAGSAAAYTAAFAQAGVLQARSISEFMAWSRALAYQKPAGGNRLAIVTNAGGPGVLSADEASRHGIELVELSDATKAKLDEVLPAVWSHNNPIDVIGDATPERYRDALNIIGGAPEVDGVVVIMTVQAMTSPDGVANAIIDAYRDPSWDKPLCSSFLGLVGTEVGSRLDAAGIPEFNTPEVAVSAMGSLMKRGAWLARKKPDVRPHPKLPQADHVRARQLLAKAREAGQSNLDLALAREVLACAGIRYNGSGTAVDADEAIGVAEKIGYPVVVKLISPDVVHKSDVGGVVLDVVDAGGVREACGSIRELVEQHQPGARITGFIVEQQISGTEIIVGMSRDAGFGPLMMVGMGGVFVEVYKDVTFRLVPMDERDALEMIGEIKAQPLLDGARGRPLLDRGELAAVLRRVSDFVEALPEVKELDLNPLVITPDGLVAIDARVII